MKQLLLSILILLTLGGFAQKPQSGVYTYVIKWAEWNGKVGPEVKVVIKKDSIFVYATDNTLTNIKKGELFEKGKIAYHKKLKKWIIATKPEDSNAEEAGGCSDGPSVIDFIHKWYWLC